MSYREQPISCPACGVELDTKVVALADGQSAAVEHCSGCGSAYFDWFDGDPGELAQSLVGGAQRTQPLVAGAVCPKCQAPFAADDDLEGYRCTGCTGLFLTEAGLLVLQARHAAARTPDDWLARLGRLLGW